jgi:hypothetical protein
MNSYGRSKTFQHSCRSQDFMVGGSMVGAVARAYTGSGAEPHAVAKRNFKIFAVILGLRSTIQSEFLS